MLKTAVVSDLLLKLSNQVVRFRGLLRPIIQELLKAVYHNYDQNDLLAAQTATPELEGVVQHKGDI
jgi:hypothetical protein